MNRTRTKNSSPSRVALLLVVIPIFLTALERRVFGQNLRPVVFSLSSPKGISAAPLLFAKYLGYFKDEGVDAKLVVMSSDIAMKGLLTGDVDFASSVSSVVKASAIGVPVKSVINYFNGSFFYLVSKPEFTRIEQLRNKVIAISRYGSATDLDARGAFRHFGMDPNKDITILAVGGGTARIAGLISGRFDATILNVLERIAAEKAGMKALLLTGQYVKQPVGGLGREEAEGQGPELDLGLSQDLQVGGRRDAHLASATADLARATAAADGVLRDLLGLDDRAIAALRAAGAIGPKR